MGYRDDGHLLFNTKIDESGFNEGIKKLGTVAKAGLAVLGSAVAGFSVITKNAFDEVARLEQNVGGIETLFGAGSKSLEEYATSIGKTTDEAKQDYEKLMEAQNLALDNANKAYKTAGLSANDYMSTVTSFAAALKQSVADEVEAAKAADQAIIDMSDNANKMGTSMESIQNAYQGFAKQNYTMLDNLKLGYGGTKEEMKRLLEDAEKLSGIEYDISNLADVYSAIHVIQTELGITGTTAKEAATTIEGSMSSAKAAWSNFMAGTGTVDELAEAFETAGTVASDRLMEIVPRLIETLPEAGKALVPAVLKIGPSLAEAGLSIMEDLVSGVMEAAPQLPAKAGEIISKLIGGIQDNAPAMLDTAANVLAEFVEGIAQQLPILIPQALSMVVTLADNIIANMPTIINAGISLLKGLIQGLIDSLPLLIENGPRIINDFADAIYAGLWQLIKTGAELIISLIKGIWENKGLLLENAGEIFMMFINIFTLSNLYNLGKNLINNLISGVKQLGPNILNTGESLVKNLVSGIKNMATHPVQTVKDLFLNAIKSVKGLDWKTLGKNIIDGIINGLKSAGTKLLNAAQDLLGGVLSSAKKFLGIHSPSTVFRDQIGKNMALGVGVGFKDNVPMDDMESSIDNSIQRMKNRVIKITTSDESARHTVGGFKEHPELNPEQGGFDFDEYERRQRKLNKERDSRPIFLGTDRIDRPLPKGAVPVW